MTECNDPECKENLKGRLEDLETFTFGEKPGEGVMGEIGRVGDVAKDAKDEAERRIPKAWLGTFILAFGVFILVAIVTGYHTVQSASSTASEARNGVRENTEKIQTLDRTVVAQTERFNAICASLEEIKRDVKHILRKEPDERR